MSLDRRAGADLAALVVLACLLLGCGTTNVSPSNRPSPAAFRSPVDLGSPVNSQDFDGGPSISADGLSLYFITDRDVVGGGDVWVAIRSSTSEPLGPPESLGAPVNSSEDEGSPSISADGLELFFDRAPDGRIYVATRPSVIATFGGPQVVDLGRTGCCDGFPAVSADGRELYFCSTSGPPSTADRTIASPASRATARLFSSLPTAREGEVDTTYGSAFVDPGHNLSVSR